jgi:RNA polymerase sigma-70 factor, ECF subfamily
MIEQLYERHSRAVYRRARQLLGEEEIARDVTHEVFVRIIRARRPMPPLSVAWLYRVTTNLCLSHLRDSKRRSALLAANLVFPDSQPPTGETRVTLAAILRHLPENLHDVAVYHFVDELTYDEIAALTGMSRRTVGNRLAAFRENVERVFADGAGTDRAAAG